MSGRRYSYRRNGAVQTGLHRAKVICGDIWPPGAAC